MKLHSFVWRSAWWLLIAVAAVGSLGAQQPEPAAGDQSVSPAEDPLAVSPSDVGDDPRSALGPRPLVEGVFAPYVGRSPCGDFDNPNNTYFGDGRQNRSLILGRAWMEMDYLAWRSKGVTLPPLVAAATLAPPHTTTLLLGNEQIQDTLRSGAQLNFGYWFTPQHIQGLEVHFLWLDGQNINFQATGNGQIDLFHPVINAATGQPGDIGIAFPGIFNFGSTQIRSDMSLFGTEELWRHMLSMSDVSRLDFIGGYRYLRLFDRLDIRDAHQVGAPPNNIFTRIDDFVSKNDFHGGEMGLIYRRSSCCWSWRLVGKVAFGGTRTISTVNGRNFFNPALAGAGGAYTSASNIGEYGQSQFAAVGEFGTRLEYAMTPQLRFLLGYNYLYWSKVARAPDSIDPVVNLQQLPPAPFGGAGHPGFVFQNTNFWSHGLTFGGYFDF